MYAAERTDTPPAWPAIVRPEGRGAALIQWAERARPRIEALLQEHGAALLPECRLNGPEQFNEFFTALVGAAPVEYRNQSTPRTQVKGHVYTSTEYPADEHIPLHNENSYTHEWPMRIAFFAQLPSSSGGETPIADSRRIYQRLSPALRERFETLGVLYVRNFGAVDLPWQRVFQTEDRAEVERQCRAAGMEFEWPASGPELRTRERCQAVARHPVSGEKVWFNQAHLFHISNYRAEIGAALLQAFGEESLPRNSYYGDGSRIEAETLAEIRAAYDAEAVAFPWKLGDVVLLDNMLCAHGRRPYGGPRRILVAMAHPLNAAALEGTSTS
jgi:alpha-ketoglutarate-dependent taurine dioxygenase